MGTACTKGGDVDTGVEGIAFKRGMSQAVTHSDIDIFNNIILLTDSYKVTHHLQYPPSTEIVYSYFECRGGLYDEVCFFGLQYFLKRYLVGQVVTRAKIDEAEVYFRQHFSHPIWGYQESLFNKAGWEHILEQHEGRLPIAIKAVPEGTVLPWKNVLFTLENTDPKCFWLTNYLETLLVEVWYPTTVATQGREQKKTILRHLNETDGADAIAAGSHLFQLTDFGFRATSSVESAALGGAAHLVNFLGSKNMAAMMLAKEFYGVPADECAGYSFPDADHAAITSWGQDKEAEAMKFILEKFPKGSISCVSDSYDVINACKNWGTDDLKEAVENREGTLFVRPDSGSLPQTVVDVLEELKKSYETTVTNGFRRLPDKIRVMQADGIDINTLDLVLRATKAKGWAADNLVFGSGGALLQKLHRDTLKCAFKCSFARVCGEGIDVVKDPITDPGKKSKKGKLTLEKRDNKIITVSEGRGDAGNDMLREVFRDGKLLIDENFEAIRKRSDGEQVEEAPKLQAPLTAAIEMDPFGSNIILMADSSKALQHQMYPAGTQTVYSYFECRSSPYQEICFFGLQYFVKKYLQGPVVTAEKIDMAEMYIKSHFKNKLYSGDISFNRDGWQTILNRYGGLLPIIIKAVPEGTVLSPSNVLFTVENSDPECFWLSQYLETLLMHVWYTTTVCTQSREQKKLIVKYLKETGCGETVEKNLHLFKLHDFGFRGVSSVESAATGGAAHLVNFMGTDTIAALVMLKEYYSMDCAGFSIPASEHSTITSWGKDRECEAFRNMLEKYPKGVVACVSDSFDIFNACEQYWGTDLKELVENRDGFLVIRPDSGKLPGIVIDVLDKLECKFPTTMTATGHRLLPSCVRIIQGDGIDINSLEMVLKEMHEKKWAIDNITFGSGGALLQKLHRDMLKCAYKCSFIVADGVNANVAKDPITDPEKRSKKGRLTLDRREDQWVTVTEGNGDPGSDVLREIFRDGKLLVDDHFEAIRKRAECDSPETN